VAHNHLKHFPNCLLPISSTLINLDVSHNHIDHLDAVMLSNTPNLISLNLAHNKLTLLPDNVFSHLNHLIWLDLSYNTIRANFKELFHEIQHVKELNLANIGLAQWPHLPLPSLIALNLSSNALDCRTTDHIPANLVIRLGHLRNLDLSRNRFTLVPAFLWQSMPLLKHLDLSSNPIRLINRESFAALVRLQTLSLQSIGVPVLENIDGDSLHSLFSLTHIRIQTWPGPHLSQLLGGLRGLRKLSVEVKSPVLSSQFNYIATIDTAPKLREIEISGAHLKTIHPDVFANTGFHTLPECGISLKVKKFVSKNVLTC
jgi:Leucine-rich repeat (LRR) protein